MLQIKTIYENNAKVFDEKVNQALLDGWYLARRTFDDRGFLAELERESVPFDKRGCNNCKHCKKDAHETPCVGCYNRSKWESGTP